MKLARFFISIYVFMFLISSQVLGGDEPPGTPIDLSINTLQSDYDDPITGQTIPAGTAIITFPTLYSGQADWLNTIGVVISPPIPGSHLRPTIIPTENFIPNFDSLSREEQDERRFDFPGTRTEPFSAKELEALRVATNIEKITLPEEITPHTRDINEIWFHLFRGEAGKLRIRAHGNIQADPNVIFRLFGAEGPGPPGCRFINPEDLQNDPLRMEGLALVARDQRAISEERPVEPPITIEATPEPNEEQTIERIKNFYREFQSRYCRGRHKEERLDRFMHLIGGNTNLTEAEKAELSNFPVQLSPHEREIIAFAGALHGEAGGLYLYGGYSPAEKRARRLRAMDGVGKVILYRVYERERGIRLGKTSPYFSGTDIRRVVTESAQFSPMNRRRYPDHHRMLCDTSYGERDARETAVEMAIQLNRDYRDRTRLPRMNMFYSPIAMTNPPSWASSPNVTEVPMDGINPRHYRFLYER
ncbi:hypothetical protein ACFLRA_01695 [Bdellovibrionota bacterium]